MNLGNATTESNVAVTTTLGNVFVANDTKDFDFYKIVVTNNGGGVLNQAVLQYNDPTGGWTTVDASAVTSAFVPLAGGASATYYTTRGQLGRTGFRFRLKATGDTTVNVSFTPYELGATVTGTGAGTGLVGDTVAEQTSGAGVTVDGVLLKDSQVSTDTINELTAATGVTIDGVLLKDTTVDLNGTANALILDADGNTHISAPTDDQIDIAIGGADDFTITANTFTALSGSSIATNTISETTAASGVTIDSVLLKDGIVAKVTTATATADGLTTGILTGNNQFVTVTSASANNIIALPALSAGMIGTVIRGCVGSNGFELRVAVADATTGKINDVTTNVEAAIPADTSFRVECISATQWILTATTKLGAVVTAIVPDAV